MTNPYTKSSYQHLKYWVRFFYEGLSAPDKSYFKQVIVENCNITEKTFYTQMNIVKESKADMDAKVLQYASKMLGIPTEKLCNYPVNTNRHCL